MEYSNIFTSVLFSLPQVLYVIAEGTLNPSDICYLVHFCNRSSGARPPPPPPLLSLLEETWSKRHSNSPPPPRPNLATLQGKPLRHDPAAWSMAVRTKKKREGDPIVFLQLSDIHLDQLFAEVGIYPCGSHGNLISSLSHLPGVPQYLQPLPLLSYVVQWHSKSHLSSYQYFQLLCQHCLWLLTVSPSLQKHANFM